MSFTLQRGVGYCYRLAANENVVSQGCAEYESGYHEPEPDKLSVVAVRVPCTVYSWCNLSDAL